MFPSSRVYFVAFNTAGKVPGIAASLTCSLSIDGATRVDLAVPAVEVGNGEYYFNLTEAQRVGSEFSFSPSSSTSGVQVVRSNNVHYSNSGSNVAGIFEHSETIQDANGPLDGVTVTLYTRDGVEPIDSAHTNSLGNFTVRTDVAGEYDLVVQAVGYNSTRKQITIG